MPTELEKIAREYGDSRVRRKKQRRKRQKLLVRELLVDYAKNSTLHGLRYIVDHALTLFERFFWFVTVVGSLTLCSFYIYNVIEKWKTSPVIVTVNGRQESAGSVPFPAVTICPNTKVNPFKYNYTEKLKMYKEHSSNMSEREYARFLHIDSLCDSGILWRDHNNSNYSVTDSTMAQDIMMAVPSLDEIFEECTWHASDASWAVSSFTIGNCGYLFKRVLTADGVCYSTNSLGAEEIFDESIQSDYKYTYSEDGPVCWNMESGYYCQLASYKKLPINLQQQKVRLGDRTMVIPAFMVPFYFPRRGRVFNSAPDVSFILRNDPKARDKSCNKKYTGYKIYLHHPADMPQSSLYYYTALPNQLTSVAISFNMFNTDSDLEKYDPKVRQCYFPSDKKLSYFKIYTAKNCQAECLANYTYKLCKCVGFNMPFNNSREICFPGYRNNTCIENAKNTMAFDERLVDMGYKKDGCHCLPECNAVEYDADILKTEFHMDDQLHTIGKYNDSISYSKIELFFKKPQFVTMQRRELFGVTDLLANIGGLLGLFLGFSFLSLIEIIYFLIVRVGFLLKRDLQEEKAKEKAKLEKHKAMIDELEKIAYVYGDICVRRKKQRRKRQKLLVNELLVDYAKNSTLHGLRYIVDHALTIFERLFWFLTVLGSLALCSFYIYNVVLKWKTSPVIVTVNGRLASVGSVPFPAVTICPQLKVNPKAYNYTEYLAKSENNSLSNETGELKKLLRISSNCDAYVNFDIDGRIDDASYVEDLIEAAPSLNDILFTCVWTAEKGTQYYLCDYLISRVITSEGVCYTFNGLAATDIFKDSVQKEYSYTESFIPQLGWSIEDGYNYSSDYFYPRRGRVASPEPELQITLINNPDLGDKTCNTLFSGYKVYLHHPADIPHSAVYYYAGTPKKLSSFAISFHEFNSDSDLASYDPKIRQCYFPKDRQLRYFKIYTAKNCLAECLSNYTYDHCGCVGYEMPFHNSSEICLFSQNNARCIAEAREYMAEQESMLDLGLTDTGCQCLPACNTVEYDAEILKSDFDLANLKIVRDQTKTLPFHNPNTTYTELQLFYKKSQFVTMQRRELFGVTDLLANIGGLLGLFLGFSFLSLIEIIYFLTVRIGFILKRDLEEEKKKEKVKADVTKYQ